jgi:hypothetical protein
MQSMNMQPFVSRLLLALLVTLGTAGHLVMAGTPPLPPSIFFVANEGQWEEPFAFKLSAGGTTVWVTETGLTIDIRQYDRTASMNRGGRPDGLDQFDPLRRDREPEPAACRGHVLKMNFVNANPHPLLVGQDKLASYSNYFLGRDSCKWRSRVGHYQCVIAENVWEGIDVEFVADAQGVKTNYHVHPGANVSQIQIEYEGLDAPLRVDGSGNLVLAISLGDLKEQAPWAYQIDGRHQRNVGVQFAVLTSNRYGVLASSIDASKGLVIDPLLYGSYLGGEGPDYGYNIAVDTRGKVYVGGRATSDDFPTTPGAYEETNPHGSACFVSKFTGDLDTLVYSTYVGSHVGSGGTPESNQTALVVDNDSRVWGGGGTRSWGWPVTPDAYDMTFEDVYSEGYFYRLNANGSALEYCSYLGGSGLDEIISLALDPSGQTLWIAADAAVSPDFPVTENALYPNPPGENDVIVGKFGVSTLSTEYLSYLGGENPDAPTGIFPVDAESAWIWGWSQSVGFPTTPHAVRTTPAGHDGFVTLWNTATNELVYSSLIGGAGYDIAWGLSPFADARLAIVGETTSPDFPITANAPDTTLNPTTSNAFVTVLSLETGITGSTFLSGTVARGEDQAFAVRAVDDEITVLGQTYDSDFPVTPGAEDTVINNSGISGLSDLFFAKLSADITELRYSTYFGGNHVEYFGSAHFVNADTFWVTGQTGSTDFPCSPNAYQSEGGPLGDVFIAKYALPPSSSFSSRPTMPTPVDIRVTVFPNPLNGDVRASYVLPSSLDVTLCVFDVLGRVVASSALGRQAAGHHDAYLPLQTASSGSYMLRLQAGSHLASQKIVLLK